MIRKLIPCMRQAFGLIRQARAGKITEAEMIDGLLLISAKIRLIVEETP